MFFWISGCPSKKQSGPSKLLLCASLWPPFITFPLLPLRLESTLLEVKDLLHILSVSRGKTNWETDIQKCLNLTKKKWWALFRSVFIGTNSCTKLQYYTEFGLSPAISTQINFASDTSTLVILEQRYRTHVREYGLLHGTTISRFAQFFVLLLSQFSSTDINSRPENFANLPSGWFFLVEESLNNVNLETCPRNWQISVLVDIRTAIKSFSCAISRSAKVALMTSMWLSGKRLNFSVQKDDDKWNVHWIGSLFELLDESENLVDWLLHHLLSSSACIPVSWVHGLRSFFLITLLNHLPQEIQILHLFGIIKTSFTFSVLRCFFKWRLFLTSSIIIFLFDTDEIEKISGVKDHVQKTWVSLNYENLSSRSTSCAERTTSPVPDTVRQSNRDKAKALAAPHASIALGSNVLCHGQAWFRQQS